LEEIDDVARIKSLNAGSAKERIQQAIANRKRSGLVPYEGQWLPREEVRQKLQKVRRKSVQHAIELAVLYFAGIFLTVVIVELIKGLVY
jgi:hypothetical protein